MGDFDPAVEQFAKIDNRYGLKVFIKIITPPKVRGNAYLVHGFRDVHDTPHMRALTAAFVRNGYRVIVWDGTHSWGRSGGDSNQATFYYHQEDLEDVLNWSAAQTWYRSSFCIAGHSLGGMMAGTYAAAHPRQVEAVVLVAPVVSGRALKKRIPGVLRWWLRRKGHASLPRAGSASYSWEFIRSSWAYSLVAEAHRLTMPVLIVGAGRDWIIPPRWLRRLYRAIQNTNKQLVMIPSAHHGFDEPWEMERLRSIVHEWISSNIEPKNP